MAVVKRIILATVLFTADAWAGSGDGLTLGVADTVGQSGAIVQVTYSYDALDAADVAGFQFDLLYPPSAVTPVEITNCAEFTPPTHTATCTEPAGQGGGVIRIAVMDAAPPPDEILPLSSSPFGRLFFAINQPGQHELIVANASASNVNTGPVSVGGLNGIITGTVTGGAGFGTLPPPGATLNFGSVIVGQVSPLMDIKVSEIGDQTLVVEQILIDGPFVTPTPVPFAIPDGGQAVDVDLRCAPDARGPLNASLTLPNNSLNQPGAQYSLSCTGLSPNVQVDTTPVMLSAMVGEEAPQSVPINVFNLNDGFASLATGLAVTVAGDPQIQLTDGFTNALLAVGENDPLRASCDTSAAGMFASTLIVSWNDPVASASGLPPPQRMIPVNCVVSGTDSLPLDVAVELSDGRDSATPSETLVYTLAVSNLSQTALQNVLVSTVLDEQLRDITWTCENTSSVSCPPAGEGDINTGVGLAGSSAAVFTIAARIAEAAQGEINSSATALLGPDLFDSDPANNTAVDVTVLDIPADGVDLALSVTPQRDVAVAGDTFIYRVDLSNNGTLDATEVGLFITRNTGLSPTALEPSQGACFTDGTARCALGDLATGASAVVMVATQVTAAAGDVVVLTAAARQLEDDSHALNNTATLMNDVVPPLQVLPVELPVSGAAVGQPVALDFTAGGGQPPYTLAGDVPPGFAAVLNDGVLQVSGAPVRAGRLPVVVSASDASQPPLTTQQVYVLPVATELQLAQQSLPTGFVGESYHVALSSANGVPPFVFSVSGLPPGLNAIGPVISGVPEQSGTFDVLVQVTDAQGNTLSQGNGQVRVLAVREQGLTALDQTLPAAVQAVSYGRQLVAVRGAPPYRWRANGLPPGLSIQESGFITGIPRQNGSFSITASVSDSAGATASNTYRLEVAASGLVDTTPRLPPGLEQQPYRAPQLIAGGQAPYLCTALAGSLPPGVVIHDCQDGFTGTAEMPAGTYDVPLLIIDSGAPQLELAVMRKLQIGDRAAVAVQPEFDAGQVVRAPVPRLARGRPAPQRLEQSIQGMAIDAFGQRYLVGFGYNGNDYDILILKFTADGTPVWQQRFDSGADDYGYGITINPADQGVYVSGYTLNGARYEAVLLRYDGNGVQQWERRNRGGVLVDALYALSASGDTVFAVGERFNGRDFDGLIAAYDSAGNLRWEQLRATAQTETGYAAAYACPPDQACQLFAGGALGAAFDQGWVAALDPADGTVLRQREVSDASLEALAVSGQNVVIAGNTSGGTWRVATLSTQFDQRWATVVDEGSRNRAVSIDRDGFIYLAGRTLTGGDGLIAVLSPAGELQDLYPFDEGAAERLTAAGVGPGGLLSVAGFSSDSSGNRLLLLNLNTGKAL